MILRWVAAAGLFLLFYSGAVMTRAKYNAKQPFVRNSFMLSEKRLKEWIDYKEWTGRYMWGYYTITPQLRAWGISRDDLVYSTWDYGINISLYLMDQKGFTDFYFCNIDESVRIR